MKTYSFEKLEAWIEARRFSTAIYELTSGFPREEIFGITSQMRRAAISVNCNISEGVSRVSPKEQARYTEIAFGSLMEVLNLIIICQDLGYITKDQETTYRADVEKLSKKLSNLRKDQLGRVV